MTKNAEALADMLRANCKAALTRVRDYVETGDPEELGAMDAHFCVDSRGRLVRIELLMTCGGPTVWAHVTAADVVDARGTWGGESCQWSATVGGAWDMLAEWCPLSAEVG